LTNTLLALIEYPGSTLLGVNKLLSDKEYRKKVVDNVKDQSVKSFWVDEFAKYTDSQQFQYTSQLRKAGISLTFSQKGTFSRSKEVSPEEVFGAFNTRITFNTTGGTTTEQPVFNFAVIKGVAA
jgi:hypothetical protein